MMMQKRRCHYYVSSYLMLLCSYCIFHSSTAWIATTTTTTASNRPIYLMDRSLQRRLASSSSSSSSSSSIEQSDAITDDDNMSPLPSYEMEPLPIRIGHGFDIHRMAPLEHAGQPLVIGGVTIPHSPLLWTDVDGMYGPAGTTIETQLGVVAHSDGDVVYHSIVDAIFGALTLPDIGQVFQDSDPKWKGCDSSKFMEHAYTLMKQYGYKIGNVDVTLILERPKVAMFKLDMKTNIVRLLQTTPGRVNIKARTHERVDSVGQLQSLSCHVVLTLEKTNERRSIASS